MSSLPRSLMFTAGSQASCRWSCRPHFRAVRGASLVTGVHFHREQYNAKNSNGEGNNNNSGSSTSSRSISIHSGDSNNRRQQSRQPRRLVVQASTVESFAMARKMRVLCFHSFLTNSDIMQRQLLMSGWDKMLEQTCELVRQSPVNVPRHCLCSCTPRCSASAGRQSV